MRMTMTMALAVMALSTPMAVAQEAAPAAPSATAAPAPTSGPLTGLAAWERLKGNTIDGKAAGQGFSEYFDPAGGVKYVDKDGPSAGTWAVQNGKVCFDFPEDDDRSCSVFEVNGATGTAKDDDGTVVRFDILAGNAKGL